MIPKTQTSISILSYGADGAVIDGRKKKLDHLTDLPVDDVFRQIVPYMLGERACRAAHMMGLHLFYRDHEGQKSEACHFYFAECAADVLTQPGAIKLAGRLKRFRGDDMMSSDVRREGKILEDTVKDNASFPAFLLYRRKEGVGKYIVKIEAIDKVVNQETGELYFPFPLKPEVKPTAPSRVFRPKPGFKAPSV